MVPTGNYSEKSYILESTRPNFSEDRVSRTKLLIDSMFYYLVVGGNLCYIPGSLKGYRLNISKYMTLITFLT